MEKQKGCTPSYSHIRAKPARQIYCPPNLRKNQSSSETNQNHNLNINAKEFESSKNSNLTTATDKHKLFNAVRQKFLEEQEEFEQQNKSKMNSSNNHNHNQLMHSKSSGSMFSQLQQYLNSADDKNENLESKIVEETTLKMEIKHSKSSGNVFGKNKVKFFEDQYQCQQRQDQNYFYSNQEPLKSVNKLQKSKTTHINYEKINNFPPPQPQQMNQFAESKIRPKYFINYQDLSHIQQQQSHQDNLKNFDIRRTKSFCSSKSNAFYQENKNFVNHSRNQSVKIRKEGSLKIDIVDFELFKWSKEVQMIVSFAIQLNERIPARLSLDLVSKIFKTLLGELEEIKHINARKALIQPAVNIFLYFIQKEISQTILECLANTAISTLQELILKLNGTALCQYAQKNPNNDKFNNVQNFRGRNFISFSTMTKWIIFLKFSLSFYTKIKINHSPHKRTEEFSSKFLAVLADASLFIIRLSSISCTPELMEVLFEVMTTVGPDVEKKFPDKMKEILARVRDSLLGICANNDKNTSAHVQKTLMQLIELHAAQWQLPASAVRYYYAANSPNFINL